MRDGADLESTARWRRLRTLEDRPGRHPNGPLSLRRAEVELALGDGGLGSLEVAVFHCGRACSEPSKPSKITLSAANCFCSSSDSAFSSNSVAHSSNVT